MTIPVSVEAEADRMVELTRMMLAEIDPEAGWWVYWVYAPGGSLPYVVEWPLGGGEAIAKAVRLSFLHVYGPDLPVRCDNHLSIGARCDRVPVAWALLGHTCGRRD